MWLGAGTWVGVLIAEDLAWRRWTGVPGGGRALLVAACALLCAWARRPARATVVVFAGGLLIGAFAGARFWDGWARTAAAEHGGVAQRTLRIASDARQGPFGASARAVMLGRPGGFGVRVRFQRDAVAPEYGSLVTVIGRVRRAGVDASSRRLHRQGLVGTLTVRRPGAPTWPGGVLGGIARLRAAAAERVSRLDGAEGALMAAVALGDRRRVSGTDLEEAMRRCGLAHMIAVSGTHLGIVAAFVVWGLELARVRAPARAAVVVAILSVAMVFTGAQPSAIRALIMTAAVLVSRAAGRRADGLAALGAAVVIALVLWPPVAFEVGFAMSVSAVAGIVVFTSLASSWVRAGLPRCPGWMADPLALSVCALVATAPLSVALSGSVSPIAPAMNVIVLPLVSVLIVTTLGGLVFEGIAGPLGGLLITTASMVARAIVWCARWGAGVPWASIAVGAGAPTVGVAVALAAVVLWVRWPAPRERPARLMTALVLGGLCATALWPRASTRAAVVVLDVGQGDAVLVRDGGRAALIDAGPSEEALSRALRRQRVERLDLVVMTHDHADHTGGVGALRGLARGARWAVPLASGHGFGSIARVAGTVPVAVCAGQRVVVGRTTLTVVWPRAPSSAADTNESSVVLLVEREGRSVLLAGDAESDVLERLAREGALPDVDAVKVGHHGSAGSVSVPVLRALKPENAAISVGQDNRFGHPARETLTLLRSAGCTVRRTDLDGDIVIPL